MSKLLGNFIFFFFSSRRRHTRLTCDWSSDVCSSDLNVAFSPRIARWLEERYPDGREAADGRYVVTFKVADPAWFVREVLQYGAEAEVLEPEGLREAVKMVVA